MKLHLLELRAFGPFGDTETIDFDALGAHGLFLMHGPTGSGKTSVLDAISFAIFSTVPGARRSQAERLASDHARPGVTPEVALEFTVAGRRLCVTRSPRYFAVKKRGTGRVQRPAKVLLQERTGTGWSTLSTRADEVAEVLDELIGLGAQQFAQVVLLPQGEFAAFLRAKADDRADLLRKLFDISRFSDLEQWLVDTRRSVRSAIDAKDAQIRTAVVRAEESLVDLAPQIEQWRELSVCALPTVIESTREHTSERLTHALAATDATSAALENATQQVDRETTLARLQQQGARAGQVWQAWEEGADQRAALQQRLDRHVCATRVQGAIRALERARVREQQAQTALARVTGELAELTTAPEQLRVSVAQAEPALAQAAEAARILDRAERTLPAVVTTLNAAEAAKETVRTAQRQVAERLQVLATTALAAGQTIDTVADLERRELVLAEWQQARDRVASATKILSAAQRSLEGARTVFLDAERAAVDLRVRRLAGFAGELAEGLVTGDPCPVCGSCEHPAPASSASIVRQDDIDRAEAEAAARRKEYDDAGRRAAAARATTETSQSALELIQVRWCELAAETLDESTAATIRAEVQRRRSSVDRAEAVLASCERQKVDLTHRAEQLQREEKQADESAIRATTERDSLQTQAADARTRRDDCLATHDELCPCRATSEHDDERVESIVLVHKALSSKLQQWAELSRQAEDASSTAEDCSQELNRQLDDEGFLDAAEAVTARIADPEEAELRRQLEHAHDLAQQARGVLDQPEVQEAMAQTPADPAAAAARRRAALEENKKAQSVFEYAKRAAGSLERLGEDVRQHLAQSEADRERLPALDRLADLVSGAGDNALHMRLSAYVLAARLEHVTTLANHQLAIMSGGRYQLEHTDAKAKGGARSGLGLQVLDSWTGTSRDTASLSGGETFMVSLALALALGQAVLHEAGGRPLQTLLVDEGFGSLDDESLELVMQVLDELRSGGRTVGIVSHVSELRTRVPAQIRVHKTEQGSRVEVLVGDAGSAA